MLGCLTLPFRLLGLIIVVLAALGLWLYADRVPGVLAGLAGGAVRAERLGVADPALVRGAMAKLGRVGRAPGDSVVLTADETATLLAEALGGMLAGDYGSLEVRLGDSLVRMRGVIRTGRLPADLLGPAGVLLREAEPLELAGPLVLAGRARGEWRVREAEVRGIPLPTAAVTALVRKAVGDSAATGLAFPLPPAVRDLRVTPAGLILHSRPRA
jgi:hypothetical protein